jgi:hypothetical protein
MPCAISTYRSALEAFEQIRKACVRLKRPDLHVGVDADHSSTSTTVRSNPRRTAVAVRPGRDDAQLGPAKQPPALEGVQHIRHDPRRQVGEVGGVFLAGKVEIHFRPRTLASIRAAAISSWMTRRPAMGAFAG